MQKVSAICLRIILLPVFMYVIVSPPFPVRSMTPEQCRVKAESCMRACPGSSTDASKVVECYDRCNSPLSCNVAGGGTSIKGTNRDPAGGSNPTKGPIQRPPITGGIKEPPSSGTGVKPIGQPPSGGTTVIEQHGGKR
jgi:hypothetical protein